MKEKICSKCGRLLSLDNFYYRKDSNRYLSSCKDCERTKSKQYNQTHKELKKQYYEENKEYFKKYQKEYYNKNKDIISLQNKKNHQDNLEHYKEYQRKYYLENKSHVADYNKKYRKNKKENDPVYKRKCQISTLLRNHFNSKGTIKSNKIETITGLASYDLYNYLLETFKNKYGREYKDEIVHIDHINPLANAHTLEDVIKWNHYTNLQLLLPVDNMRKWKYNEKS